MATYSNKLVDLANIPTNSCAHEPLVVRGSYTFTSAVTLADGDVIRLVRVPNGFQVMSIKLDNDALGSSCVGVAGILDTTDTTVEHIGISGAALSSAGVKLENSVGMCRAGVFDVDRVVGVEITTSAGAALTVGAKIGVTVSYIPKPLM